MTYTIFDYEVFPIGTTGKAIFFSKNKYTNSDVLIAQDLEKREEAKYNIEMIFAEEDSLKKGHTLYILSEPTN